jgi:hypothetical protein
MILYPITVGLFTFKLVPIRAFLVIDVSLHTTEQDGLKLAITYCSNLFTYCIFVDAKEGLPLFTAFVPDIVCMMSHPVD